MHRRSRPREGPRPGGGRAGPRPGPGRSAGDDPTTRLATAMGAHPAILVGLAGLGALVATCSSPHSRASPVLRSRRLGLLPPTRSAPTVQNSASAPPGLASWPAPTGPH
ncbi:hypothetical protein [Streptomyces sp. NBC_01185]|uniref:hypothetical protein n=1 Tax=Streptomyces sp. NBC_01185 TaxID=2903764 RepID=UPI00386920CE